MKKNFIINIIIVLFLLVVIVVLKIDRLEFSNNNIDVETESRYFGNEVRGDFNGDGTEDVAFLFTQNSGGSGTFYYVTVKLGAGNNFKELNPILLGDRISPQTTEFKDGTIIVNYADRKLDEPMTAAPSVALSAYFTILNDKLVQVR